MPPSQDWDCTGTASFFTSLSESISPSSNFSSNDPVLKLKKILDIIIITAN